MIVYMYINDHIHTDGSRKEIAKNKNKQKNKINGTNKSKK